MPGPNRDTNKYRRARFADDAFTAEMGPELYSLGPRVANVARGDVRDQVISGAPRQDPQGFYIQSIIDKIRNRPMSTDRSPFVGKK